MHPIITFMNGEPSQAAETRKLAAIMFTDIVGFSCQNGADEERARKAGLK